MICGNCGAKTNRIRVVDGVERCPHCSGMSEVGTRTDGVLTRNRFGVRQDSLSHEGDMLTPHKFDKSQGKVVPNDDFLKRYPQTAGEYFDRKELDRHGYENLEAKPLVRRDDDVDFSGETSERLKELKLDSE